MRAIHLDTCTSTSDYAVELIRAGIVEEWVYVLANAQTHGRGTHGRAWHSPAFKGIYLSVARVMRETPPATSDYTLAAGVACANVIEEETGLRVRLRPVNDIYVGDAKLGGILAEALVEEGRMQALVVGVGLNLRAFELPPEVAGGVRATSFEEQLPAERFRALKVGPLVAALVKRVQYSMIAVAAGRHADYRAAYELYSGAEGFSASGAPS